MWLKPLKRKIERLTRQDFFYRPQTITCTYQATLTNQADVYKKVSLVLPVPPQTENQKILGEIYFTPSIQAIERERTHGNSYAVWQVILKPGESQIFKQKFDVQLLPITKTLNKTGQLPDYKSSLETARNLADSRHIQTHHLTIKELARKLKSETRSISDIVKRINEYVIRRLDYGNPIVGLYDSLEALTLKKVDCGGFDTLMIALCRAAGIPARLVNGFWTGYENGDAASPNKNDMHAWLEIQMPSGEWIPADPSVEQLYRLGRSKKLGEIGQTGSDRIIFSYGCDYSLDVNNQEIPVEILQKPLLHTSDPQIEITQEIICQKT